MPPYGFPPYGGYGGYGPPPYGGYGPTPVPPAGAKRRPVFRPWRAVGAGIAAAALVALGVGIGYSAWGSTQTTSASSPPASRTRSQRPLVPHTTTTTGATGATGAFPGAGSKTAKDEAFLGVEIASTTTLPTGPTSSTPTTATGPAHSSTATGSSSIQGAHVLGVVSGSPAAKGGIVKGDVITGFDTLRVVNALTLSFDVSHAKVGQSVRVDWSTATGNHEHATVKLTTRTAANRAVG